MPRSFSECASEIKANHGGGSRDLRLHTRWNSEAGNTPPIIMSRLSLIVTIVMRFSCKKMPGKKQYYPGHVHRDAIIPNALSYAQGGGVSKFPHGRRTLVKLVWCGAPFQLMHYLKCPADNLENASTIDCKQTKTGTVRVGVPKRAALYGGGAAVLLPRGAVRCRHIFCAFVYSAHGPWLS